MKPKKTKSKPIRPAAVTLRPNGKPRGPGGPMADAERIARVEEMLTMQFSPNEVARQLAKPKAEGGFGVTERTIRDDVRRVFASWADESRDASASARDQALRTARKMFRRAIAAGDMKTADRFFDKSCRILGAYAPDALRVLDGDRAAIAGMTDDQLDLEIAAELKRSLTGLPPERRAAILARATKEA